MALSEFRDEATTFLRASINNILRTEETITFAIRISKRIDAVKEHSLLNDLLIKQFPSSLFALEGKVLSCKTPDDYNSMIQEIEDQINKGIDGEGIQYYLMLSKHFSSEENVFYAFYENVIKLFPSLSNMAAFHASVEAMNRGYTETSIKICLSQK